MNENESFANVNVSFGVVNDTFRNEKRYSIALMKLALRNKYNLTNYAVVKGEPYI